MPNETPGDSSNATDASSQTPAPKYVTEEQIGNVVNAAVSSHIKRFTEKQLPQMFEAALKPISDKLNAPPPPAPEGEEKKGNNKQDPQIAALQQQLEDFKRQAREAEERRVASERKSREDGAFSALKSALTPHVRPEMLDALAGYMFKVQGAVEVPEDGEPVFKTSRSQFGVEEEVRLPIKDGIAGWLKTDAAKPWLPAPGTSNLQPTKKPNHQLQRLPENFNLETASDEQKIRAAAEMEQQIRAALAAAGKSI